MQSALAGNQDAYRHFLTAISNHLRPYLMRRVPAGDAEDVLQEILISVHKARHTYDGQRAVLPWIATIARFRLNDYLRQHYARMPQVDLQEIEEFLSADVTEGVPETESIKEMVEFLPERQQRILHLMHAEGLTAKEVGAQLRMKESAVKVAAHRAYKLIKQKLGRP